MGTENCGEFFKKAKNLDSVAFMPSFFQRLNLRLLDTSWAEYPVKIIVFAVTIGDTDIGISKIGSRFNLVPVHFHNMKDSPTTQTRFFLIA